MTAGTGDTYLDINTTTGLETQKKFIQSSAGAADAGKAVGTDANGLIDVTFMPTGIGPDTVSAVAVGAIADGDFVNLYLNGGVLSARKADASVAGKEAWGFVLAAVADTATGVVYLHDKNTHQAGMTIGQQWLSAATPGKSVAAPPTASGNVIQSIGQAYSASAMMFVKSPPIVLA